MADNYENIPDELKKLPRWVVATLVLDEDDAQTIKAKKCPINARTGKKASTTNPDTWSTFAEATAAIETERVTSYGLRGECGVAGYLGFVLGDGYAGIDLDHVISPNPETGEGVIAPWAYKVVCDLNSYAEYSPSGTGIHVICRGVMVPENGRTRATVATNEDGTPQEIEMYDHGRYFRMTGDVL